MAGIKQKMKIHTKTLIFITLCFLVIGCKGEQGPVGPKGDKGDTGTADSGGVILRNTYTGTPTSNPFSVSIPDITTDQVTSFVINCYVVDPSNSNEWKELPLYFRDGSDVYEHTVTVGNGVITFQTYLNGASYSGAALLGRTYKIMVRKFASPQLKAKWLKLSPKSKIL